jgi:hypothetical protein
MAEVLNIVAKVDKHAIKKISKKCPKPASAINIGVLIKTNVPVQL